MPDSPKTSEGGTDIAALSAAVIASSLSVFVVPGPFDAFGALVALSLIVVIFAYVWRHPRSAARSLAVAVVLGIIAIPVVGFAAEMCLANDPLSLLRYAQPFNCLSVDRNEVKWIACTGDNKGSRVDFLLLLLSWYIIALSVFAVDRFKQGRTEHP